MVLSQSERAFYCNCQKSRVCPLNGKCLVKDIIHQATWERNRNLYWTNSYNIQGTIRQPQGLLRLCLQAQRNRTQQAYLATKGQQLWIRDRLENPKPRAALFQQNKAVQAMHNWEILHICKRKCASLNKRNELISKCNHCNKFLLKNVKKLIPQRCTFNFLGYSS